MMNFTFIVKKIPVLWDVLVNKCIGNLIEIFIKKTFNLLKINNMKNKISILFATALLFGLNPITEIGGTPLPPKGNSGPAMTTSTPKTNTYKKTDLTAFQFN